MAWTWTGNTLPPGAALWRTSRDLQLYARSDSTPPPPDTHMNPRLNLPVLFLHAQELFEAYEAEGKASGKPRLMLSAAVSAGKGTIDAGYEIAEISKSEFSALSGLSHHSGQTLIRVF